MATLDSTISNFVAGDDVKITRTITAVPAGDSLVKAWLTVKKSESHADADAIFQKAITTSYSLGQGHITDNGAGDTSAAIFFELTAANTALLRGDVDYYFDIQVKTANGAINTPEKGTITFRAQVTQTTS